MISFEKPLNALKGLRYHFNFVYVYCISDNNSSIVKNNWTLKSTDRSSRKGDVQAHDVQNIEVHIWVSFPRTGKMSV